ncbi:hypothetical protein AVEN_73192-1 [Araneus ventricosus]|uniref:Uncharacterized protein n=1 Tax=Araneus ventricosus TaxID=182803 RepID=A0A4Y2K912_ARAVE|nr:hypothetical protein AVEN_73192-1 [Araneus ventricosus]
MGWGERRVFLEFEQCQLSLWFLRRGGEFPLSLKEELGRSRILRFLYSNGLRNQKVKQKNKTLYGENTHLQPTSHLEFFPQISRLGVAKLVLLQEIL